MSQYRRSRIIEDMDSLIISNLRVTYGKHRVLEGLNAAMHPGRVYGLLGLNGAGKSTLFQAILGLLRYSGSITHGGAPIRLDNVGATINGPAFYPQLTARKNLTVHALLTGTPDMRIDEVLQVVGLDGSNATKKKAGSFSTGMKVRLALAMALLTDPPICILDEPQNGLDPQGIKDLRFLIRWLAQQGKIVIISSHQLGEVAQIVDDIGILSGGCLSYEGPLEGALGPGESFEDAFFRLSRIHTGGLA